MSKGPNPRRTTRRGQSVTRSPKHHWPRHWLRRRPRTLSAAFRLKEFSYTVVLVSLGTMPCICISNEPSPQSLHLATRTGIADVYEREGGRGCKMTFMVTEIEYHNQKGEKVAVARSTLIETGQAVGG